MLKAAFDAERLSEGEYRAALLEAWLGEQLKRSDKYAQLSPKKREAYVSELVTKKEKKKAKKPAAVGPRAAALAAVEVKRDSTLEDARIAAWPADVRQRWESYRQAYEQERERRKEQSAALDTEADSKK